MNNIGDYLAKFSLLDGRRNKIKQVVISCLNTALNFDFESKNVVLDKDRVSIKTNNLYKTEIFLRKKEILSCINEKIKPEKISDIK